ncbi:sensor histidine kinase [Halorussus lipolyticus]|uniref:sensor histidine kinase n=1 Tax=Halorussus lipolyticus TaxID=3034024 RepID=UPI0023E7FAE6|nr:HAMP domain-containing sensor histidine kinase [Halorussus sp. DT80]
MSSLGDNIAGPLSAGETNDRRSKDDLRRAAGSAVIALTGFGLLIPTVTRLISGPESLFAGLLAGLGTLVSMLLVGTGYLIYHADFSATNTVRIAVWNTLGVLVLGSVFALVYLYDPIAAPPFVVATVLGVSAAAHVIIGVNDVRRIRAEELATEREKTAVLNRLIRHNLRNDTQVLSGFAERLTTEIEDPELADMAERVHRKADDLGGMYDEVAQVQQTIEGKETTTSAVELLPVAEAVAERLRADHPDAEIEVSIPDRLSASADDRLGRVLANLAENGIEHNPDVAPTVEVSAEAVGDRVEIRVADDGPGIPDDEVAVLTGERAITQLDHGSGFGLWLVKWVAEEYGGELAFEERETGGTVAVLRLDAA